MQERFDWSPGVGAAHLYPMDLYFCAFIYSNGNKVSPARLSLLDGTWGQENGISVVGDQFKPIPVALEISWLSYTENKFYKGFFRLPYDKILRLFKQGYKDLIWQDNKLTFKHMDYNTIAAGLAPGGVVVVWISGGPMITEIGRFKAEETTIKMEDFAPNAFTGDRTAFVKSIMDSDPDATDNLRKNGIPFGLWDKYRQRFNQRPVLEFDQEHKGELSSIYLNYYNGERDVVYPEKWEKNDFKLRARVKEMQISWTNLLSGKQQGYYFDVKFDEAEMFKVYQQAYANDPEQNGELIARVNDETGQFKIYLKVGSQKPEVLKAHGEIYLDNDE